jgi:NTE family protein
MLHRVTRRSRAILAFLLVSLGLSPLGSAQEVAPVATPAQAPAPGPRPRIGVAFGGGAAKGIAHIGVIRWFEQHRIPVDVVAGTSMGGLVGGAYASGMNADELEALMNETDWDLMFLADSPFKFKTFRRKEDARAFPGQIDFGL